MQSPTNTPYETDASNAAGEACHASGQPESKDDVTYLRNYDMTVEKLKSLDLYTDSENHDNTAQPMETLKRISSSHVQEDSVTSKIDNPEATDSPMVFLPARPRLITQGFENCLILYEKDIKKNLFYEMDVMNVFPAIRFVSEVEEALMLDPLSNLPVRPRIMVQGSENCFILYETDIKKALLKERGVMNLPTIRFVSEVEEVLMLDLTSDSDD